LTPLLAGKPSPLRQYFLLQYFVEPACDAGDVAMVF